MGGTTKDAYAPDRTRYLGNWITQAACGPHPNFEHWPDTQARTLCAACPVLQQCGRWIINDCNSRDEPDHIIAGMTRDQRAQVRLELHRRRIANNPPKKCCRCKQTKPAAEFRVRSSSETGLTYECVDCLRELDRERRARVRAEKTTKTSDGEKRCKRCRRPKALFEFWANKRTRDGRESVCRDCRSSQQQLNRNGLAA
jgi:Transcription factor WhiB